MTEVLLRRITSDSDTTIGTLFIDGTFHSFVLEDEARLVKLAGETRIPAGRYEITRCFQSGILSRMQAGWYKGSWIPSIEDVPGFEYIRIHPGNNDDHTEGCLLPGFTADVDNMTIGKSRDAFISLVEVLDDYFVDGNKVWLTIEDCDQ
jgi:hypothetical protein